MPSGAAPPEPAGAHPLRLPRARAAPRGRPRRADRGALGRRSAEEPRRALTVLLSKLRAVVGADVLTGRSEVRLTLPPDARVDVEQALAAVHRAESAVVARRLGARLERRAVRAVRRRAPAAPRDGRPPLARRLAPPARGHVRARARDVRRGLPGPWRHRAGRRRARRTPAASSTTRCARPATACSCGRSPRADRCRRPWGSTSGRARCCARSSGSRPARPSRRSTCSCSSAARSARRLASR